MHYDVIVAGGGPAGSTAAREAAAGGARVLLLDKAAFPREKPCGGGVNIRAARLLPFDLTPVVERTVTGVAFSMRLQGSFTRRYSAPLTYMTQRSRLDAFLVEQAVAAGVELHERDAVRALEADSTGVTVRTAGGVYRGAALIGADGAHGVVGRLSGLAGRRDLAVAYEGNIRFPDGIPACWRETAGLDLGLVPGGYAWLFPKGDHVNVGVGGWQYAAPTLKAQLRRVTRHYGLDPEALTGLRGYHLPVRAAGSPTAGGRIALAGDAAGFVDPLSGEGIYAAVASGRTAAAHALDLAAGRAGDFGGYVRAIREGLEPELTASSRLQDVFNLAPPVSVGILRRSDLLWNMLCRIIRGDGDYASFKARSGPFDPLIDGLSWMVRHSALGRAAGLPAAVAARAERAVGSVPG